MTKMDVHMYTSTFKRLPLRTAPFNSLIALVASSSFSICYSKYKNHTVRTTLIISFSLSTYRVILHTG